jgi:hypothetical protein
MLEMIFLHMGLVTPSDLGVTRGDFSLRSTFQTAVLQMTFMVLHRLVSIYHKIDIISLSKKTQILNETADGAIIKPHIRKIVDKTLS